MKSELHNTHTPLTSTCCGFTQQTEVMEFHLVQDSGR